MQVEQKYLMGLFEGYWQAQQTKIYQPIRADNSRHEFGFSPAWSLGSNFWGTEFSSETCAYVYFFNVGFILEKTKEMCITHIVVFLLG